MKSLSNDSIRMIEIIILIFSIKQIRTVIEKIHKPVMNKTTYNENVKVDDLKAVGT